MRILPILTGAVAIMAAIVIGPAPAIANVTGTSPAEMLLVRGGGMGGGFHGGGLGGGFHGGGPGGFHGGGPGGFRGGGNFRGVGGFQDGYVHHYAWRYGLLPDYAVNCPQPYPDCTYPY